MGVRASHAFPNNIGELRRMSEWLQRVAADSGLDSDTAWQAELCLNEAAANIILYGHGDGSPHEIQIDVEPIVSGLQITIADDGQPFNPLEAPPPPSVQSLEDAPVGGLGIHLIRSFANDVRYRREHHRNVLVLTFVPTPNNGR